MKNTNIRVIEGTATLAPLDQLTEEFAKDKWDAHLIPGLRYAPHTTNYYIDFQRIPVIFRPVVKEYIKHRLSTGVTVATLHRGTFCLGNLTPSRIVCTEEAFQRGAVKRILQA